jgi:hypothetical protein
LGCNWLTLWVVEIEARVEVAIEIVIKVPRQMDLVGNFIILPLA